MNPTVFKRIGLLTALFAIALVFLQSASLQANEKYAGPWKERAKERLMPLSLANKKDISQAQPEKSGLKGGLKRKSILVFYRCETYIHTSIPWANYAFGEMGRKTNTFSVDLSDEYAIFNKKTLENYDAILFNSSSSLKLENSTQREAILEFVRGGKGVIGVHGASDNFYEWSEGAAMMGGHFNGHPWTREGLYAFKLNDPAHKLNAAFSGKGFWHRDEIYQYDPKTFQGEENLRILVSLDMSKQEVLEPMAREKYKKYIDTYGPGPREVPVSWIREYGKGRLFYTNLGHREETWTNPVMMQHVYDGILYALGFTQQDATPTAKMPPVKAALAPNSKDRL